MRYLIVNADDFGMSSGVNRGIVEAHRRGILTSTSLMVNRPAAEEAALMAREAPELSVGLHLEFANGAMADARTATEGQIRRFEQLIGRPPTHLDSHHDGHRDPRVLPHVIDIAKRLGIPVRGHSSVRSLTIFYGQWGGETHLEQVSPESLLRMLETAVPDGVTELICHPGFADVALDSSYGRERETELQTLCDPWVRETLQRVGIRLVDFRDLTRVLNADADGEVPPTCRR